MDITFLQGLWFILIGVLIIGYFVLDGFDLGIGVLYPILGKTEREKAIMRRSVGPVWDGNEVWLLTAGGALFAAFAPAYATSFSGFYLAIILVLFGLIARAVSLEFRAHDPELHKVWDAAFVVGSFLPALLFGVAIGNVLNGLPLEPNGDYLGSFFALLNPFSLLCGVMGLVTMLLLGASWLTVKTDTSEDLYKRAQKLRNVFAIAALAVFVLCSIAYFVQVQPDFSAGLGIVAPMICAVLLVVAIVVGITLAGKHADLGAHIAFSIVCVALVALTFTSLWPNIIPAVDPAYSITIAGAASSEYALTCMTIITCIGLPLVLLYHFIVYRTFAGKITDSDLESY